MGLINIIEVYVFCVKFVFVFIYSCILFVSLVTILSEKWYKVKVFYSPMVEFNIFTIVYLLQNISLKNVEVFVDINNIYNIVYYLFNLILFYKIEYLNINYRCVCKLFAICDFLIKISDKNTLESDIS